MIVKNREQILSHGNMKGRRIALDLIEYAMKRIDARQLTRKLVRREGEILKVGPVAYDLAKMGDVWVLGAGKGVFHIAQALEDQLGDRIKTGVIVEKKFGHMEKGLEGI